MQYTLPSVLTRSECQALMRFAMNLPIHRVSRYLAEDFFVIISFVLIGPTRFLPVSKFCWLLGWL